MKQVKEANLSCGFLPIVVIAGDIFHDGWRERGCPPELINFAIENLDVSAHGGELIAIPGQHDLPHHRLEDVKKSAFWTLCRSRRITSLSSKPYIQVEAARDVDIYYYGFPWKKEPCEVPSRSPSRPKIAVMHRFVWKEGNTHPGAKGEDHVANVSGDLRALGYDIGIAGDNHRGFCTPRFAVPGGFYRSRTDERDYKPAVVALYKDLSLVRYTLDVSKDEFVDDNDILKALQDKDTYGEHTEDLVELLQSHENAKETEFYEVVDWMLKKTKNLSSRVAKLVAEIKDKTK